MKHFNLLRFVRVGALVLCLTTLGAISVSAQNGNTRVERTETRTVDNDTDWGWIGLLGLLGLAGLLPKKRTLDALDNRNIRTDRTTDTDTVADRTTDRTTNI